MRGEPQGPFLTQDQHPLMTVRRRERSHSDSMRRRRRRGRYRRWCLQMGRRKRMYLLHQRPPLRTSSPPFPPKPQKQSAWFLLWHSTNTIHLPPPIFLFLEKNPHLAVIQPFKTTQKKYKVYTSG